MYTSEQAAGVTWGAIAALLGTFRSEHPLLSFDFVKILRIIRLAELQSFDVNEDLVTASQVVPPNDARLGMDARGAQERSGCRVVERHSDR